MATTHRRTPALRATALVTAAVLSGALAGCAVEGDPAADAATPGTSPSRSADAAPSVEPSPTPSETATPEPTDEASEEPTESADGDRDAAGEDGDDEGEEAGAPDDAPGSGAGNGDDEDTAGEDGENSGGDEAPEDAEENEKPELPEHVAYGEVSERVGALQSRLQELGYHITTVDGSYGGETQQALWAFQKAAGLYRDGVVGPATQKALDNGVVPRPRSSSGKVIEIDIDRQLLLAVQDGRVVRTLNAASGNGEQYQAKGNTYWATTPRGDFTIYNEINGVHASTLELGDMNRPKYFNGGIAVHGSDSVPPFPASHGCVRVSHAAINWIWDTWGAPVGTRVLVY